MPWQTARNEQTTIQSMPDFQGDQGSLCRDVPFTAVDQSSATEPRPLRIQQSLCACL